MKENSSENKAPRTVIDRLRFIGPSAIVTGSVVGSGSIVMTPLLGAAAGFTLLWWLLLSIWTKPIIQAEISRYVVVTKKTFLEAFAEIPGPKTNINGKTTSWLVWFMFLGVLPAIIGMGGLVGAVAEAGTNLFPSINIELWVVLSCLITWLILIRGSYLLLENILLGMVLVFSLITLVIAFSMQSTSYELSTAQVFSGLNFTLPFEYLPLALAVFGFTGGKKDFVIDYRISFEFHEKLLKNNIYSEIHLYQEEGHGFKDLKNKINCLNISEKFLKKIFN